MASKEKEMDSVVEPATTRGETEVERGALEELDVDLNTVLKEDAEIDIESDQSPYPEGTVVMHAPVTYYSTRMSTN